MNPTRILRSIIVVALVAVVEAIVAVLLPPVMVVMLTNLGMMVKAIISDVSGEEGYANAWPVA